MRKLILLSAFLLCSGISYSQSTNISTLLHSNVKKGDQFFDHFAYRNALKIYLHAHEKDSGNYYLREKIGTCYFKLHDPESAEIWFGTLAKETDIHAEIKFEYAEALSMNGKYDESKIWFEKYLADKPGDKLAQEKVQFLNHISDYTKKEDRFFIMPVNNINTDHSEYGAHYFHSGIVFASSRDSDPLIKHKPADGINPNESLLNIYYAVPEMNNEGGQVIPFHSEHLKTVFHEGPMAFYDNYSKGAFTQSNVNNGRGVRDEYGQVNLQINFAEVAHLGALKNITPFEHNHEAFSNAHPSFASDGKVMYFSSTRNLGFGESDIYYSEWVNGHWTIPVNAGPEINTREDESFPFLANDTTLYFSSNGHGTLGGLDLYVSHKSKGVFSRPVNLGYPANTRFDDFSLVTDSTGRIGFIASNRPGGKGLDDIYFFISNYYVLVGTVRELSVKQTPLAGTKITAFNPKGDIIDSVSSDDNGNYRLELPFDQDFTIAGAKEGYETLEGLRFNTKGKPLGVDSLTLPMWKHGLYAKGKIYSRETQTALKGSTVVLKNLTVNTADSLVVEETGEYSFLIGPNRQYEIVVKKDGFVQGELKLNTKGIFEGELLNDFVLEEVYIEKEVILFEYNEIGISAESKKVLERILRTLKKVNSTTLYIGAHADSRGTIENNLLLSYRRATATMDYLVKNGISKQRIEAVGFGEELILNRCSDGVECPEDDHSKNRRAEIKIQKGSH